MTTPLTHEQITSAVNDIAKGEARRRGVDPDMFQIELVPHLKGELFVDFGRGPTVRVLLAWPEGGTRLMMHTRAIIQILMKYSRLQYALVPASFVREEEMKHGRMRASWKKGRAWDEVYDRIPDLIPAERIRVEHETITRYVDIETGAVIEKKASIKRLFNHKVDSNIAWAELSAYVNEEFKEDDNDKLPDESSVSSAFDGAPRDEGDGKTGESTVNGESTDLDGGEGQGDER